MTGREDLFEVRDAQADAELVRGETLTRDEVFGAETVAERPDLCATRWDALEIICAEHGLVEIWVGEEGDFNVDVGWVRGQGATLAAAVADALVKLEPRGESR